MAHFTSLDVDRCHRTRQVSWCGPCQFDRAELAKYNECFWLGWIGDNNATGLLESQTFSSSNTTTTSFFDSLGEASSNTTSNTESNETSQPDTNFTDAMATSSDSCMLVTMVTSKNQVWLDHDSKPIATTSVGLAHTLRGFSFSRTQNRLLKDGFSSFGTKCVGDRNRRANLLLSRHR